MLSHDGRKDSPDSRGHVDTLNDAGDQLDLASAACRMTIAELTAQLAA